MRILSLRLIVALIVGVTLVSFASSWSQVSAEKEALRRDLERKAEAFNDSMASNAEYFLQNGDRPGLVRMIERFRNRDHLLGLGIYDREFFPLAVPKELGADLPAARIILAEAMTRNHSESTSTRVQFKRVYMVATPLHAVNGTVAGGMVVIYDTSYIRAEIFRVWGRAFVHFAGQIFVIVAITLLIVRWSLTGPIDKAAKWLKSLRTNPQAAASQKQVVPPLPSATS